MKKQTETICLLVSIRPELIDEIDETASPWYETEEEIEAKLQYGKEKAGMLAWVRSQMFYRLTPFERNCVRAYFFRGLTYREAGAQVGASPSSIHRGVQRAIVKLRKVARTGFSRHKKRRRH